MNNLALNHPPFQATSSGLQITGSPDIEDWLEYGKRLREVQGALRWVIGDYLNYGENVYGEMYSQAYTLFPEYHESSIRHMRRVAESFSLERRRTSVTWSIHSELASASSSMQDEMLDLVEAHGLTREELREAMRGEESERHACPLCGAVHVIVKG